MRLAEGDGAKALIFTSAAPTILRMNKRSFTFMLLTALPLFSSCGLFQPRQCQPEAAQKIGFEDALAGNAGRAGLAQGGACKGDYSPSSFEKDYMSGFMRGREEACQSSRATELAVLDAREGMEMKRLNIFGVCTEGKNLKESLEKAYRKAFASEFCNLERAKKSARNQADALQEADFSAFKKVCDAKTQKALSQNFTLEYETRLRERCSPLELQAQGMKDAKAKIDMMTSMTALKACPLAQQAEGLAAYSRGYSDTQSLMLKEEELKLNRDREERERQLRERELQLGEQRQQNYTASQGGGVIHSVNGQDLLVQCDVRASRAQLLLKNLSERTLYMNGPIEVDVYDERGQFLTRERDTLYKTIAPRGIDTLFVNITALGNPTRCSLRFRGPG